MKVGITGVSGYLGGLIARALDADPEVESILGLDIVKPDDSPPKMTFQQVDVRDGDFSELFSGIDVVYHLAFIVEPPRKLTIAQVDAINIDGSRNVFEGAIKAGVPKIIYSSSAAAYGAHPDNPIPLYEDSPLRPNDNWYYSKTKGAVESLLDEIQKQSPDTIIIRFRPSIFLGPKVNNSIGKGLAGKVLICLNTGLKIDLCWDEDIVKAFCLALGYDRSDIFNLSGEEPLTTHEMGELLGRRVVTLNPKWVLPLCRLAVKLKLLSTGMYQWFEVGVSGPFVVSTGRAKEKLGWIPAYNAADTLVKYTQSLGLPIRGKAVNGKVEG
jgi:UDP-glucose 4-epimerase